MLQEVIWSFISNDELETRINKMVAVGGAVKDQPWTNPAQKTEKSMKERVELVLEYHNRMTQMFTPDEKESPQTLDGLE